MYKLPHIGPKIKQPNDLLMAEMFWPAGGTMKVRLRNEYWLSIRSGVLPLLTKVFLIIKYYSARNFWRLKVQQVVYWNTKSTILEGGKYSNCYGTWVTWWNSRIEVNKKQSLTEWVTLYLSHVRVNFISDDPTSSGFPQYCSPTRYATWPWHIAYWGEGVSNQDHYLSFLNSDYRVSQ